MSSKKHRTREMIQRPGKGNSEADLKRNIDLKAMSKTLVAYFSVGGTTARAAKSLADASDADLYEIRPAKSYTQADLNWMDKKSRSSVEMNDKSSRPALADKDADISAYDTILLGFPIWWYTAPRIINSFLESYDFSGKKDRSVCHLRRKWTREHGK